MNSAERAEAEVESLKKTQIWHDWFAEAQRQAEHIRDLETEVARLNRALAAGREEYELAVAEMNRRGEEVARLKWQRDYVIDIAEEYGGCDFTGPDVESLDDKYAARHEERKAPPTDDYKRARGAATPPPASDPPEDIIRRLRDGDSARYQAEHDA